MSLDFLASLSESRLFPTVKSLSRLPALDAAELVFLHVCALRVLLADDESAPWARRYCRRAAEGSGDGFRRWRPDANDLGVLLHALSVEDSPLRPSETTDRFLSRLSLDVTLFARWLRGEGAGAGEDAARRLFVRLDGMLRVTNPSMRSIRRLVGDWTAQPERTRRLAVTRLLQFLRDRAARGEVLPEFERLARRRGWEIEGACNIEAGEDCGADERAEQGAGGRRGGGLLATLAGVAAGVALSKATAKESASAGATGAANIATAPTALGGLGAGFDPNGHERSIYPAPKKQRPARGLVLRRPPA